MPRDKKGRELVGIPTVEFEMPEPQDPGQRYILYHDEKGVFLGSNKWSNFNATYDNCAPTYEENLADHFCKWFENKGLKEVRKLEVQPDMDFNLISPKALEEQGLPSWEPTEPPEWVRRAQRRGKK